MDGNSYPRILESVYNRYSDSKERGISLSRFKDFCSRLKKYIPREYDKPERNLSGVFAYFDVDGDGYLSEKEFNLWWYSDIKYTALYKEADLYDKAYILFCSYAEFHSNFGSDKKFGINVESFNKLTLEIGSKLKEENRKRIESVFNRLDSDNNGVISFQEFCLWLNWFTEDHP